MGNQKNHEITLQKNWVLNLIEGKSAITEYDLLIYTLMRSWARPAGDIEKAREVTTMNESVWIFELDGFLVDARKICDYLYDVSRNTRKKRVQLIKQNICALICSDMIVCYNKQEDVVYSCDEYMENCDNWDDGRDIVYYFPVPADYFTVSADEVKSLVSYCKRKKDNHPEYFLTLFLLIQYNLSITRVKGQCFVAAPMSTYFTSRRRFWERVDNVLESSVCVIREYNFGVNANGEPSTIQLFFSDRDALESYRQQHTREEEGEGVSVETEIPLPPQDDHVPVSFKDRYEKGSFKYNLAKSLEEIKRLPPKMSISDKLWDEYDEVSAEYKNWIDTEEIY